MRLIVDVDRTRCGPGGTGTYAVIDKETGDYVVSGISCCSDGGPHGEELACWLAEMGNYIYDQLDNKAKL